MAEKKRVKLCEIPVDVVGKDEIHAFIEQTVTQKKKARVINLNLHALRFAFHQTWFREFLQKAECVFCDGDGPRLALKILGESLPEKVPTTRWIWQLAEFCAQKKIRLFLLGAKPGVAEEAAQKLTQKNPELEITGTHHGYFEKSGPENEAVIKKINEANVDVLMVCFGMPAQEKWIDENFDQVQANVFLKGGAVMDYVTERLGEAPQWMLKLHLEWLFRICEEPMRLLGRYLWDFPYVFSKVLVFRLRSLFTSNPK